MPFEHDNQLMLAGEISRDFQAVCLNFGNAQAGQARHLPRVRSDDDGSSAAVQLAGRSFEGIQRVRIHNQVDDRRRGATLADRAHEFSGPGTPRDRSANMRRLALRHAIASGGVRVGSIAVAPLLSPAKTCAGRGAVKVTMASARALSLKPLAVCASMASALAPEGMSTATIGTEAAFILPIAAA